MALTKNDETRIRDYLLGHLSDEEQQKIEERLMADDELFEELEISKGELIEEYCANELAKDDYQWFKDHYLASVEGRQRRDFALALDSIKRTTPAPQRPIWFERLNALLTTHRWTVAVTSSAALVALAAIAFIYISTLRTPPTSYAFTLNNTLTRRSAGDAGYYKVPWNSEIGELRITLQLPEAVPRGKEYRVELDDRREITNLKATSNDANSVLVVISAASLREDLYALRLYAIKDDGTEQLIPGQYLFELVGSPRSPATQKP